MNIPDLIFTPPVIDPISEVKRGRGRPRKDSPNGGETIKPDVPPKNRGKPVGPKLTWPGSMAVEATLLTGWENFIVAPMMFIDTYDAEILGVHGPLVIHELVELAIVDKKFRRILEMLAKPGKYGGLLIAVSGMVLPILSHHGVNPIQNLMSGLLNLRSPAIVDETLTDGSGGE